MFFQGLLLLTVILKQTESEPQDVHIHLNGDLAGGGGVGQHGGGGEGGKDGVGEGGHDGGGAGGGGNAGGGGGKAGLDNNHIPFNVG